MSERFRKKYNGSQERAHTLSTPKGGVGIGCQVTQAMNLTRSTPEASCCEGFPKVRFAAPVPWCHGFPDKEFMLLSPE